MYAPRDTCDDSRRSRSPIIANQQPCVRILIHGLVHCGYEVPLKATRIYSATTMTVAYS